MRVEKLNTHALEERLSYTSTYNNIVGEAISCLSLLEGGGGEKKKGGEKSNKVNFAAFLSSCLCTKTHS